MNPYEVLGVAKDAQLKTIKAAYRKLSSTQHPDAGGKREDFERSKLAFDILSDPDRRKRYDTSGRTDETAATPARIKLFIQETMRSVVAAARPDGSSDDPVFENIKDKIILTIHGARVTIKQQIFTAQRKVERAQRMIERFKFKGEGEDLVGDALRVEKANWEKELKTHQDAMELSQEAERVLLTYNYQVGPGPEGHYAPGPTIHRSGAAVPPAIARRLQGPGPVFE